MNNLERVKKYFNEQDVDRIPFSPAVYSHKAFIIDDTPTNVATNPDKLFKSLMKEYELYKPDFLNVGIDVYNVEAEALGVEIKYYDDFSIPAVKNYIIEDIEDIDFVKIPNPEKDGRMPIFIGTTKNIVKELGKEVYIRGALSGPFSLASIIFGFERLLFSLITEPESVKRLLEFSCRVIERYAKAFINTGAGIVIFDSRCSPPNISPKSYKEVVAPFHKRLMEYFKENNVDIRPLIIGGDTNLIVKHLFDVEANLILSDYNSDFDIFLNYSEAKHIFVRRNIDPVFIYNENPEKIYNETYKLLKNCSKFKRVILGTGIIPFDTPSENVLAVKKALIDFYRN